LCLPAISAAAAAAASAATTGTILDLLLLSLLLLLLVAAAAAAAAAPFPCRICIEHTDQHYRTQAPPCLLPVSLLLLLPLLPLLLRLLILLLLLLLLPCLYPPPFASAPVSTTHTSTPDPSSPASINLLTPVAWEMGVSALLLIALLVGASNAPGASLWLCCLLLRLMLA
jgi:hypothetical protein